MLVKARKDVKDFVNRLPDICPRKVGVLFSGGRDSSILAALLMERPNMIVHLLTMKNGVSYGDENIDKQVLKLSGLYPGALIVREWIDVVDDFQVNVMQEIEKDFRQRNFRSLLVCAGCKYIMHLAAKKYAVANGLHAIVDGFSVRQNAFPEQTSVFMLMAQAIYADTEIVYGSPLYEALDNIENIMGMLQELKIGNKSESKCMFAHAFSTSEPSDIYNYLKDLKGRI